jgi:hypothetical protein
MANRELSTHINPRPLINPAAAVSNNTAIVSSLLDTLGYDSVTLVIAVGAAGTSSATFTASLTEGNLANGSDQAAVAAYEVTNGVTVYSNPPPYAAIGAGLTLASFTGAATNSVFKLAYVGNSRYIQLTITPAGNSAAAFISAVAILGHPDVRPTPNPPA